MSLLTYHDVLAQAKDILRESRMYDHVIALMKWDSKTYMPSSAKNYRANTSTYFSGKRAQLFTKKECQSIAEALKEIGIKAGFSAFAEE